MPDQEHGFTHCGGPSLEVAHGGFDPFGGLAELGDSLSKKLPAAPQAAADRALGYVEDLRELGSPDALEVVQLEGNLQVDRQPSESSEQELLLLLVGEQAARAQSEVLDGRDPKVDTRIPTLTPKMVVQLAAGHGEQIGAKGGVLAKAVLAAHAGEEGLLDQVLGPLGDLVAKEPKQRVEVTLEELVSRPGIAGPPGLEEGRVGGGHAPGRIPERGPRASSRYFLRFAVIESRGFQSTAPGTGQAAPKGLRSCVVHS